MNERPYLYLLRLAQNLDKLDPLVRTIRKEYRKQ